MNFCLFISFLLVRRSCLAHTRERAQVPHRARVPHTWILNGLLKYLVAKPHAEIELFINVILFFGGNYRRF